MQKTKIEWCDYTLNPIVGCKHGCSYCYAKKMNDRFHFVNKWEEPEEKPLTYIGARETLDRSDSSKTIFVGSMSDMFGDWVRSGIIHDAIWEARCNPRHTFMFLTKNPKRYMDFIFSENVMLGMTYTGDNACLDIDLINFMMGVKHQRKFLSIEPLLGFIPGIPDSNLLELVIVGAQTGSNKIVPEQKWIESVTRQFAPEQIFWKENIKKIARRILKQDFISFNWQ